MNLLSSAETGHNCDLLLQRLVVMLYHCILSPEKFRELLPPQALPKQHAASGAADAGWDNLSAWCVARVKPYTLPGHAVDILFRRKIDIAAFAEPSRSRRTTLHKFSYTVLASCTSFSICLCPLKVRPERLGIFLAPNKINLCDHLMSNPRLWSGRLPQHV